MTINKLWFPPTGREGYYFSHDDKIEPSRGYLDGAYSHVRTVKFIDYSSNEECEFRNTLSDSDNRIVDPWNAWNAHDANYKMPYFGGYVKNDNYVCCHFGKAPEVSSLSDIKNSRHIILPGYIGLRFVYRWPNNGDVNHWDSSPIHINKVMFHYYDPEADAMRSFRGTMLHSSVGTNDALRPDMYRDDASRKSDTWKGCYYQTTSDHLVRNRQLCLTGVSFEFKFTKYGGASHSRCIQLANMVPIWEPVSSTSRWRPVLLDFKYSPYDPKLKDSKISTIKYK